MSQLFSHFNFDLLNDPRFKEDSVREELVAPLIKDIGYINSGNTQILRSVPLKHPFVSVGTTRKNITVIPDYLMTFHEKPAWVLEAKSPQQPVNLSRHAEQAYSYAIHPEIRVKYFALCNGREFVLYNVNELKPKLQIPMQAIDQYREFLKELLGPEKVFNDLNFTPKKDLGLHMKRVGFIPSESALLLQVRPAYIVKYNNNLFSFPTVIGMDGDAYMASCDFDLNTAFQLRPILGETQFSKLLEPITDAINKFHVGDTFRLNVEVALPEKEELIENDKEIYLPVIVKRFLGKF